MEDLHHFRDGNVVLYKRQRSKRWQSRIKLPNNQWKRISTKKTDLKDASEYAGEKYDEYRFRIKSNLPLETRKFKDVAKLAIKEMQGELNAGYGKKTYLHYIGAIDRYLIEFFGNKSISKIDYKLLKQFDEWRIAKMHRKPKHSTINNHNSALNRVFYKALEYGWINEYQIPQLKNKGAKSERRPYFTLKEYRELYTYMQKWYLTGRTEKTIQIRELLRDYVLILTNTGMRHGTETNKLKWNCIDEFTLDGKKYLRFYVDGKTGSRELIARHNTRKYLQRIQDRFDDLKHLEFNQLSKVDELVFRCRDGSLVKDWHGAFEILLKDSGLLKDRHGKRRSLYSLRHTYATFELMKGREIHLLAKQLGTSTYMIEKHYSHLIPTMAANELAGKYFGKEKKI